MTTNLWRGCDKSVSVVGGVWSIPSIAPVNVNGAG